MSFLPFNPRIITVPAQNVFVSGASVDRAQVTVPPGINAWVPLRTHVYCQGASAALSSASIEIWTTGAGVVGATLLSSSPQALTNMSATGSYQLLAGPSLNTAYFATGILIRQNASAGAGVSGSLYFGIEIAPLG